MYTFVRVFFMVLDLRFVRAVVRHPSLFCVNYGKRGDIFTWDFRIDV